MPEKHDSSGQKQSPLEQLLHVQLHDEGAAQQWPLLFELLAPRYKNGALVRQEGKLIITPMGPAYQVTLDCPAEGVTGNLLLSSLVSLITDIEAAIRNGTVLWRQHFKIRRRDLSASNRSHKQ